MNVLVYIVHNYFLDWFRLLLAPVMQFYEPLQWLPKKICQNLGIKLLRHLNGNRKEIFNYIGHLSLLFLFNHVTFSVKLWNTITNYCHWSQKWSISIAPIQFIIHLIHLLFHCLCRHIDSITNSCRYSGSYLPGMNPRLV